MVIWYLEGEGPSVGLPDTALGLCTRRRSAVCASGAGLWHHSPRPARTVSKAGVEGRGRFQECLQVCLPQVPPTFQNAACERTEGLAMHLSDTVAG